MDAVRFIEERRRMYKVTGKHSPTLAGWIPAEDVVKEVEEWSDAHPRKTRQSVFLGNYPCARIDSQSVLYACPADVYGNNVCPKKKDDTPIICYDCRREFWMQEVE